MSPVAPATMPAVGQKRSLGKRAMNYERSYIEKFLDRFVRPKHPEYVEPLLQAFDAVKSPAALPDKSYQGLLSAASDKSAHVYQIATEFLGEFGVQNELALNEIRRMSESPLAHVRHNAILCLSDKTPRSESVEIICKKLRDRSSRVRTKAADWAVRLSLRQVAPNIEQAIRTEKNSAALATMSHALDRLKVLS